jgi:Tat protein translocase TatB subunit
MFNIGPPELIVILLVALLIVGPKRLPEVGKSVGRALREIRRQTDEVRSSFEATIHPDLDDDEDEAGMHETLDETGSPPADVDQPLTEWGGADEDPAPVPAPAPAPIEAGRSRSRRRKRSSEPDPGPADAT